MEGREEVVERTRIKWGSLVLARLRFRDYLDTVEENLPAWQRGSG